MRCFCLRKTNAWSCFGHSVRLGYSKQRRQATLRLHLGKLSGELQQGPSSMILPGLPLFNSNGIEQLLQLAHLLLLREQECLLLVFGVDFACDFGSTLLLSQRPHLGELLLTLLNIFCVELHTPRFSDSFGEHGFVRRVDCCMQPLKNSAPLSELLRGGFPANFLKKNFMSARRLEKLLRGGVLVEQQCPQQALRMVISCARQLLTDTGEVTLCLLEQTPEPCVLLKLQSAIALKTINTSMSCRQLRARDTQLSFSAVPRFHWNR
mmetsp:Transcript_10729/g.29858  ORF Transcript_10729/g.29858 Transcript_10729/m.29858 type:complete len:265 (+) Transcript_10729:1112-1906(+)